jgi:ceramide glucosyltransferase
VRKLLLPFFAAAIAYQLVQIGAAVRFRRRKPTSPSDALPPAVSVLKPMHGMDANTFDALVSQASQRYPRFEILFGARDSDGPAIAAIQRLQAEFPSVDLRLTITTTQARNPKVGQLIDLAKQARITWKKSRRR